MYDRIDGALCKKDIYNALAVVCQEIIECLGANQSVSVKNFGTLSPYVLKPHNGFDLTKGTVVQVKAFKSVKFHPHVVLKRLVKERREKFRGSGKKS